MINAEEIKKDWIEYYEYLLQTYENSKEVMEIPFGMLTKYDSLDKSEKAIINDILRDWLESGFNKYHNIANWIISLRCIVELTPSVEKSIEHLKTLPQDVHLKYEIKDLQRLLADLEKENRLKGSGDNDNR